VVRIDLNFDMQAVISEQVTAAFLLFCTPDELTRIFQALGVADCLRGDKSTSVIGVIQTIGVHIRMTDAVQRQCFVKKFGCVANNRGAARRFVATIALLPLQFRNDVCSVQRIVEAAPTGIRGIDRETGITNGHYELWAGDLGDFRIDVLVGKASISFRYPICVRNSTYSA